MPQVEPRFQTSLALAVAGGHTIIDVFSSFLPPLLPLLIAKHSMSMTLAGGMSVFLTLPFLFSPWLGSLADRRNLVSLFVLAPAVTGVGMSLLGVAPDLVWLCVFLMAAGAGNVVYHAIGPVVVAHASGTKVGRGMSFFMTGGELARTLGPLAAVGSVTWLGLEGIWPVMVVGVACSVLLSFLLKGRATMGEAPPRESLLKSFKALSPVMAPLALVIAARSFVLWPLMNFLPTYLTDQGLSLVASGAGLALLQAAGTAGALSSGPLSDRLGRRPVILAVLTLGPLLMAALVLAPEWLRFPLLVTLGLCAFAGAPVLLAIAQDHSQGRRGAANGLIMGMNFAVSGLALVAVGAMVDLWGYQTAFLICPAVGLLAVPAALRLPK